MNPDLIVYGLYAKIAATNVSYKRCTTINNSVP
jgi:hypothetical protein